MAQGIKRGEKSAGSLWRLMAKGQYNRGVHLNRQIKERAQESPSEITLIPDHGGMIKPVPFEEKQQSLYLVGKIDFYKQISKQQCQGPGDKGQYPYLLQYMIQSAQFSMKFMRHVKKKAIPTKD